MMKTCETDLMKGIDDKFQKLLSQLEMNMNILELKTKNVQFKEAPGSGESHQNPATASDLKIDLTPSKNKQEPIKSNEPGKAGIFSVSDTKGSKMDTKDDSSEDLFSESSIKERWDRESDKTSSVVTIKEIEAEESVKNRPKTPETVILRNKLAHKEPEHHLESMEKVSIDEKPVSSIVRYITECENSRKRNKKVKKTTIVSDPVMIESNFPDSSDDSKSISLMSTHNSRYGRKRSKKKDVSREDDVSLKSSKRNRTKNIDGVNRQAIAASTISKKTKKKMLRNTRNQVNRIDWISYNRNNVTKLQNALKNKLDPKKESLAPLTKKATPNKSKQVSTEKVAAELEEKVIKAEDQEKDEKLFYDIFRKKVIEKYTSKDKNRFNDVLHKPVQKMEFEKEFVLSKNRMNQRLNSENFTKNPSDVGGSVGKKVAKKFVTENESLVPKRAFQIKEIQKSNTGIKFPIAERKNFLSNHEMKKVQNESDVETVQFHKQKLFKSELKKAKSEVKMTSKYLNTGKKEDDLEGEIKGEIDEFFSEIPFVVGRSVSRTFNLGLSFQYAMSLLKRLTNKKEMTDVLNVGVGRQQSFTSCSEYLPCGGQCEAVGMSLDWTKEDEEALEENPWDPELNRRRPKCTCLPNNCTTLKKVLRQLTARNPAYLAKSIQPSHSSIISNKESDGEGGKKAALKKAQSQTRTVLLRNIRNIQLQLTPSEILK